MELKKKQKDLHKNVPRDSPGMFRRFVSVNLITNINQNNTMSTTFDDIKMEATDTEGDWSEDEFDASRPVEWRTTVLNFGKYDGYSMESMIKRGKTRHYLKYLLKWDELDSSMRVRITAALHWYNEQMALPKTERSWVKRQPLRRTYTEVPRYGERKGQ